jgi:hypothetical protein
LIDKLNAESPVAQMKPHWRFDLLQEIDAYRYARDMRLNSDPESVEWNVGWYASEALRERMPFRLQLLGGLVGEW